MITFALSFMAGIAAFKFFQFFPFSISTACVFILIVLFMKITGAWKKIVFVILAVLSGFLYAFLRQETLPDIIFPDGDLAVEGTIIDVPERSGGKLRFTIVDAVVEGTRIQGDVRLVIFPEIFGNTFHEDLIGPGSRISAVARLREPHSFRNPDLYSQDLMQAGIAAVGYVKYLRVKNRKDRHSFRVLNWRKELGALMDRSLSTENASFLKALIPGLKRGISRDMRDAFSTSGVAHLLSISGTHFGMLAFILFTIFRTAIRSIPVSWFRRLSLYATPTQIAVVLSLPVLFMYLMISGAGIPTVRSFIMVFIYMMALLVGRKDQWLNSLSIAATLILLWQPATVFELSFLLSFTAVLSIGCVVESRKRDMDYVQESAVPSPGLKEKIIDTSLEKLQTGMMITTSAVMGTAPLIALYFKQIPLISPVSNLIVTPLVCFALLPLSFISSFCALMFDMSFMPFNGIIDSIATFALLLIDAMSRVPFSSIPVHTPSMWGVVLYYLTLVLILKGRAQWRYVPFCMIMLIYLFSPYHADKGLNVAFLDAGQGDASVVELPGKKVMLIDGSRKDPDMGRRIVAPYLWSRGLRTVDYMVVSHFHPDHSGGLVYIMENFDVGEIWAAGRVTADAADFLRTAHEMNIPVIMLRRGDVLRGGRYEVLVLHPYDEFHAGSPRGAFSNENSDSLVLKIKTEDASILFTGDIEEEAEANLVHLGKWLKSDILKIPHHGGRTSSSGEFLETVGPRIAVASVGRKNSFRHPHKETLERYRSAGVRLFRTDIDGAVSIKAENGQYHVETYEDSRLRTVQSWRDELRNLMLLF